MTGDALLSEDERLLKNTVREFTDQKVAPRAAAYDESGEFPWDNVRGMAELGLLGLTIDETYGGSGGTSRQVAVAVEEIARGCAATSVTYIAHLSLCTQFVHMFGTEDQKQRYVPPLARGESIGAFALTEPGAGSDAAAITTTATKTDGHYVLNGSKLFITNAPEADTFVVMATQDRSLRSRGIIALVVERGSSGLTVNPQHGKMGMRASSTGEVVFDNCPVPVANLLGDEGRRIPHRDGGPECQPNLHCGPVRRDSPGGLRGLGAVCRSAGGLRAAPGRVSGHSVDDRRYGDQHRGGAITGASAQLLCGTAASHS